ncbi:helix-turn-helix domain-containing protein [Halorarum halophilum]|uniref:Helix-turn-helix domain-containing protein n=2 Tax=Halorarum halophilum TaxID=2743090 RepID=A0A7D5GE60_9EURY|nr:helix-turn-helix domain-containing protein [Halobaculum halophilum]
MEGEDTLTRTDLEGNRLRDALPRVIADVVVPHYEAALDGETATFEEAIGDRVYEFHFVPVRDDDGDVFAATAMSQDITDRVKRERELERQRERLTALDEINGVFRGITDVVVEQSSREEIEATVCEHLADADSYLSAWIGDVDGTARTVDVRTEAGAEGGLDGTEVAVGPDGERGERAMERAIRTGEIQPIRDVRTDSRHGPWRGTAEEHGVRSSAAVPFVHGDTTYGVLNVSAERPDAFEGQEREVIGQLGEVVAHAIAAADRKRALMSDEVVELQFGIRDAFAGFGVDAPPDGTITLDHTVPIRGGEYLIYGSATEDAVDDVEALVEKVPHWVDVTFRTADGRGDFELRLSEPPVLSTVASLGGSIENAVIEDGDYRMTIHLSPETHVRRVIDAVKAIYPAADLLKRRQIARRDETAEHVSHVLASDLTDRQRAALEAAYHAGFFEWPRDAAGEAVAESLDIAPSTFHQHLRKAEGKVFESLLSSPVPPTS